MAVSPAPVSRIRVNRHRHPGVTGIETTHAEGTPPVPPPSPLTMPRLTYAAARRIRQRVGVSVSGAVSVFAALSTCNLGAFRVDHETRKARPPPSAVTPIRWIVGYGAR